MRKVIFIFGLLAGIIVSIFIFISMALIEAGKTPTTNELVGYATIVIALSMIFFGIKSYRDNHQNGVIKFWKGIQVGLLITLVASLIYTFTWETYKLVRPEKYQAVVDYYFECQINKVKAEGASPEKIESAVNKFENMKALLKNPLLRFGMTMVEIIPVGVIITLISAGILRKKELLPA